MRKFQLVGVGLVALLMLGVFTASASATFLLAEWLVGGVAVTTELLVEVTGELLLEDTKAILGQPAMVLCSGILDGWVGPNSLDWVSEVLSLNGEAIGTTPLVGKSLDCVAQTGCETNTPPLVWAIGLPWESEVELLEQGEPTEIFFSDLLTKAGGGSIGWEITNCLVLGTPQEDECTTTTGVAQLTLNGTTLLGVFSTAFTALNGLTNATCTKGGVGAGIVEESGSYVLSGGGELTASSDSSVS